MNVPYGNEAFADYSAILGGRWNETGDTLSDDHTIGEGSTVSGGRDNKAMGDESTVSGGDFNTASGSRSSISGGLNWGVLDDWDWRAGDLFQDD